MLRGVTLPDGSQQSILSSISAFFEHRYGPAVATALRRPPAPVYAANEPSHDLLPWTHAPLDHLIGTLHDVPLDVIVQCICNITHTRPVFTMK